MRMFDKRPAKPQAEGTDASRNGRASVQSELAHWPVQLALVPASGPIWQGADVLIAADCVPFAMADFHERLLAGKSLAIACPKLDDIEPHVEKLAAIFAGNDVRSITVAHMEVPCCMGIVFAVESALEKAGRKDIPLHRITVGIDGTVKRQVYREAGTVNQEQGTGRRSIGRE